MDGGGEKIPVDVVRLVAVEQHVLIEKPVKHIERDNKRLLEKMKQRIDRFYLDLDILPPQTTLKMMRRVDNLSYWSRYKEAREQVQ
ncbi:hypothetical protein QJS04_geneDACA004664 [Acorus gramineus]|uniref:Uncharacterized protein n=1 Tax=Acorus gramineus TaxID=55184 RepID=A0AAV9BY02_ACOGR|nr:hypothetical protein QJS04_geneDACA004664 [Acorus gramineus]